MTLSPLQLLMTDIENDESSSSLKFFFSIEEDNKDLHKLMKNCSLT